jgi:glycosyltransferase involved in cell wall biosynthesis
MKIAIIAALYPPHGMGGAEDCAQSFAGWAVGAGHKVHVFQAAREPDDVQRLVEHSAVVVDRLPTPHIYSVTDFRNAHGWQKPLWHLQDHFDSRGAAHLASAVGAFAPDVIMIHYVQGFGYRVVPALAALGRPMAFVLHDLGLACIRMSMFKDGTDCAKQCISCLVSSRYKSHLIETAGASAPLGFIAPSRAILDRVDKYTPIKQHRHAVILNTKSYPTSVKTRTFSDQLRLLYAGKLDATKGVDLLADAVARVATRRAVRLQIAGSGPLEAILSARFGMEPWFEMLGFVSQDILADAMIDADALVVPSVWPENSPGVVIQALMQGLPIIASRAGGLPELVNEKNGIIVEPGRVDALEAAIDRIAADPDLLAERRDNLSVPDRRFAIETIGADTVAFLQSLSPVR